jgi:hypothetical protein
MLSAIRVPGASQGFHGSSTDQVQVPWRGGVRPAVHVRAHEPSLGGAASGGVLGRFCPFVKVVGGPPCCPRQSLEPILGGAACTCVLEEGVALLIHSSCYSLHLLE